MAKVLTQQIDILDRRLHYFLLHLVVEIYLVLGTAHVVCEVAPGEVLLQVVQPIQEIGRLPREVLHRQTRLQPTGVIVAQRTFQIRGQLRSVYYLGQGFQAYHICLQRKRRVSKQRSLKLPEQFENSHLGCQGVPRICTYENQAMFVASARSCLV